MKTKFYKYHGTGNDFIMIHRPNDTKILNKKQIAELCHRSFGIGADGLIELYVTENVLHMRYYNSDGGEATMCGNGGRCFAAFAYDLGLCSEEVDFKAIDGFHKAKILEVSPLSKNVILQLKDVESIKTIDEINYTLDTGSPHFVKFSEDISTSDILSEGRKIRYSEKFSPEGINVNFVEEKPDGIFVRTYERGVENETLSCGTGVTASAIAYAYRNNYSLDKISVTTLGGELVVHFSRKGKHFSNVHLQGGTRFVFSGEIEIE